jgi:hypothetical protein
VIDVISFGVHFEVAHLLNEASGLREQACVWEGASKIQYKPEAQASEPRTLHLLFKCTKSLYPLPF